MKKACSALIPAFLLVVSSIALAPSASAAAPSGIQIDVPLYSGSLVAWASVVLASPAAGMIVLNPANGPGGFPQPAYQALVRVSQERGISVVGYVPTTWANGSVSVAQAERWVGEYYDWYGVDGILFDQVNDTCANGPLSYYTSLYHFVKQQPGADTVVLNPGTAVGECYASISDVLITFEDTYANFLNYQAPSWVRSFPGSHFLNIIIDTPASEMETAINLAASRNADQVYVTDMGANGTDPYSSLPTYFGLEVSYAKSPSMGTETLHLVGVPTIDDVVPSVSVDYGNNLPFNLDGTVHLVVRNAIGQAVYFSNTTIAVSPGAEVMATLSTEGVPQGVYNATVIVVGESGAPLSQPVWFSFDP
jgi:Spherulation-specific family 4